ncbi:Dual specificity tyrosine-phosphorylation-regulated kinase 2 [Manis javanica]|nr:Dual specificity tyrosine-phosphorylation-regulated kinase 2 [Manis javanica]
MEDERSCSDFARRGALTRGGDEAPETRERGDEAAAAAETAALKCIFSSSGHVNQETFGRRSRRLPDGQRRGQRHSSASGFPGARRGAPSERSGVRPALPISLPPLRASNAAAAAHMSFGRKLGFHLPRTCGQWLLAVTHELWTQQKLV